MNYLNMAYSKDNDQELVLCCKYENKSNCTTYVEIDICTLTTIYNNHMMLVGCVIQHINTCALFKAKFCLYH